MIVVGLRVIAPWMTGAETTRSSRVNATCSCWWAAVYSAQVCSPSPLKSSSTIHSPVPDCVPARASSISVPSMIAGPSRYFWVPSSLQAAM